MNTNKTNSLEDFVERHRADFDPHEPRPDLWAALEQQLASPVSETATPTMRRANAAEPIASGSAAPVYGPAPAGWFQRYGIAAALALLVFAAGASETWRANRQTLEEAVNPVSTKSPAFNNRPAADADAALYQTGTSLALTAAERTTGADSQLVRAVRGMEAYYTNQLARRQHELRQLSGPGVAGMAADWQRELVSLDSSYRKLKLELPRHPQPDAVLTAMNRNLQIRLDILDQQLHLGTATATAPDPSAGAYVLADSRRISE